MTNLLNLVLNGDNYWFKMPLKKYEVNANTILYCILDSESQYSDLGPNSIPMTNTSMTFQEEAGVSCGKGRIQSTSYVNNGFSTQLTASIWINTTNNDQSGFGIFSYYSGNYGYRIVNEYNSTRVQVSNGTYSITNTSTVNDGIWHHIVYTYDNVNSDRLWTLYVDGVQEATRNTNLNYTKNSMYFYIGGFGSDADVFISQAIMENKAWTAAEVAQFYNDFKGNYGK